MKHSKFFYSSTLTFLTTMLMTTLSIKATRVDPQTTDGSRQIVNKLGLVFDETIPFPLYDSDAVAGVIIINTPGRYYFPYNITSRVVIDSDNVSLDLNYRSVTHNIANEHIITINSNKKEIKIHNGLINNSAGPGTGCGVLINNGVSQVTLEKLKIMDCGNGILLNGMDGSEVVECELVALDLVGNTTAAALIYADKNIAKKCCAMDNLQAGFELLHSELNCLFDCSSLTTKGNSTVVGFRSYSGSENLFERCTAKDTQTDAWEFCNKSYGFLLTGTETKTKIIDCIVNETDMTSTVSAVSYGIHLDPILYDYDILLNLVDSDNTETEAYSVCWSPDNKYLAVGNNPNLRIFNFDESKLTFIDEFNTGSGQLYGVSWSPNGIYIAAGGTSSNNLLVYKFDGALLKLIASTSIAGGKIFTHWSPNGKYIATGDAGGVLRVFYFDGSSLTELDNVSTTAGHIFSPRWSPGGELIVTGDNGNDVRVFSFNGSKLKQIDTDNTPGSGVNSTRWSPNGKYIATGDSGDYVRVYSFNGTTLIHLMSYDLGDTAREIAWSPNGKYIAAIAQTTNKVSVFAFDGSSIALLASATAGSSGYLNCISWTSCGKYLAALDNTSLSIFDVMYGPENCLIKNNIVCDTSAYGQFVGTGIMTGGNNCVIQNCCYNNDVNYSYGIPHVYYANQNDTIYPFDNISTPPF